MAAFGALPLRMVARVDNAKLSELPPAISTTHYAGRLGKSVGQVAGPVSRFQSMLIMHRLLGGAPSMQQAMAIPHICPHS